MRRQEAPVSECATVIHFLCLARARHRKEIKSGSYFEPIRTFQHIEANATQLVNVGVENFGQEADLGWNHGVVVGEKEFELEGASCNNVRKRRT